MTTDPYVFTADGVRFQAVQPMHGEARRWSGGGLACDIFRPRGGYRQNPERYYLIGEIVSYGSLQEAGAGAVRRRLAAYQRALTVVAQYEAARDRAANRKESA